MIDNVFYEIGGGAMPDLDFENPLKQFSSATTWSATQDCYLFGAMTSSGSDVLIINNTNVLLHSNGGNNIVPLIKLKKNDVVKLSEGQPYLNAYIER